MADAGRAATAAEAGADSSRPSPGVQSTPGRPSIAVVDDDSDFSSYARAFLEARGYEVGTYARGDEIVAVVRRGSLPDIVLLDVEMPGMDGLETLKALKAGQPELPVIMLAGGEHASIIVEAMRLGAADYIVKSVDPEGFGEVALEAAVKQAVERARLMGEVTGLRRMLSGEQDQALLGWGESPAMRQVAHLIEQVADSDVAVLIRGESGVGKELVARAIHQRSPRSRKPFVKVNCAALPADLLESELFGHEKGAFTGAGATRVGKFEQADLGTILLDEIGEMTPALQAKLLHVLQDVAFVRLGSNRTIEVDVRVVTATNRDLEAMVRCGEFREDLYYRLKVIEAVVPPLRERQDEIPRLIDLFIRKYAERYNRRVPPISQELRERLLQYEWPGNVRELENMIKRLVILQDEQHVMRELSNPLLGSRPPVALEGAAADNRPPPFQSSALSGDPAREDDAGRDRAAVPAAASPHEGRRLIDVSREAALTAERTVIAAALTRVNWNRRKAAERLGVSYKTLLNKIKQTGLEQP